MAIVVRGTPTRPLNDDFADRIPLPTEVVLLEANNAGATVEPGEPWLGTAWTPELAHTLWWEWTAPADGTAVFSVRGSLFESYIRVFRGAKLTNLVEMFSTAFPRQSQQIAVGVQAGATYVLQAGGEAHLHPSTSTGRLRLRIAFFDPPANDSPADAAPLAELPAAVQGSNAGAAGPDRSTWWTWTASNHGQVTATIQALPPILPHDQGLAIHLHSELAVYREGPSGLPELLTAAQGEEEWESAVAQVTWQAEAGGVYYLEARGQFHWYAGFSLKAAMNEPPSVTLVEPVNLREHDASTSLFPWAVASDPDGEIERVEFLLTDADRSTSRRATDTTPPYQVRFTDLPTGLFQLHARARDNDGAVGGAIAIPVVLRPRNNRFENRLAISSLFGCASGGQLANDVGWWSWTAPTTDRYYLRLGEENTFAQLTLYTGTALHNLVEIGRTPPSPPYQLVLDAQEGIAYPLKVTGTSARVRLQVAPARFPSAFITSPQSEAELVADGNWRFIAGLDDPENTVQQVNFELDRRPLATVAEPPFEWWNDGDIPPGFHTLRVVAFNSCGMPFPSDEVFFQVFRNPPTNDMFADRAPLTGTDWQTQGAVGDATVEPEEPALSDRSLWWSWVAPVNGPFTLRATSSRPQHNHALAVFEGDTLAELTATANGEALPPYSGQLSWMATAGTAYAIALYGYTENDTATLTLIPTAPPSVAITSPAPGTEFLEGETITLTVEATDPDGSVDWVELYYDDLPPLVATEPPYQFSFPPPNDRSHWSFQARATDNQGVSSQTDYHQIVVRPLSPPNDNFLDRLPLPSAPGSVSGSSFASTLEPDEPNPNGQSGSVWWTWMASTSGLYTVRASSDDFGWPAVAVFTGNSLDELTLVDRAVYRGDDPGYAAQVTFTAEAGTAYQVSASANETIVTLLIAPGPPPAVSLASPTPELLLTEGDSLLASAVQDGQKPFERVEFYVENQLMAAATDAPFEVMLASLPERWTPVRIWARCVDEWGLDGWASVTVHQIARPPFNDEYADRPVWDGVFHSAGGTFRGSLPDETDPDVDGLSEAKSLWWQWTAPLSGTLLITLQSSEVTLVVFGGTDLEALTPIAIHALPGDGYAAQLPLKVIGGTTYQIGLYESTGYDSDFDISLLLDARHLELNRFPESEGAGGRFTTTYGIPWVIERESGGAWIPLTTNTPTSGVFQFTDPSSTDGSRLYRARAVD